MMRKKADNLLSRKGWKDQFIYLQTYLSSEFVYDYIVNRSTRYRALLSGYDTVQTECSKFFTTFQYNEKPLEEFLELYH